MSATAKATFEIQDRASTTFAKIGAAARRVDQDLSKAGRGASHFGTKSVEAAQRGSASAKQMERAYKTMVDESVGHLEKLTAAIQIVGRERATAKVDVDITRAEAKLRVLQAELRKVSAAEATAELQEMGLVATSAAAALVGGGGGRIGGGGGGHMGGLAGGMAAVSGRALVMASALAVLAPAVTALGGAAGALVGSAGQAAGGLGVLGVGTLGALATGLGAVASVALPAAKGLKEVKTAQEAYNKALQQYGRDSAQAAQARGKLNEAQRNAPGAATVLRDAKTFSGRWRGQTGAGRRQIYGLMSEGIGTVDALSSTTAPIANNAASATRRAMGSVFQDLRSGEWREAMRAMGDTFDKIVGPGTQALENLMLFFSKVAQAASPATVRMFQALEDWTDKIASRASDQDRMTRRFDRWIDQAKAWGRFLRQTGSLLRALFSPGARPGEKLLDRMTNRMERWTRWLDRNPVKVERFFTRSVDAAVKLANAIGAIAKMAARAGDALLPMLNSVSSLVTGLSGAGALGPLTSVAALAALTRGRGIGFGRGAAMAGGAGAAAGGVGALEVAGAATLGSVAARTATAKGALAAGGWGGRLAGGAKFLGRRFMLPMAAIGGLMGASQGSQGAGFGGFLRNTTTGVTGALGMNGIYNWLGLDTRNQGQINDAAIQRDFSVIDKQVGAFGSGGIAGAKDQLSTLTRMLAVARKGDAVSDEHRNKVVARLQQEIEARKALLPELRAEKRERQRGRGGSYIVSVQEAYERDSRHNDPKAFDRMVRNVRRGMARGGPGAQVIAEQGLDAVRAAAGNNPKLVAKYEELVAAVEHRFRRLNVTVNKVNGDIYRGTEREWSKIAAALIDPAEQSKQRVTKAFTDIQQAAIGSLMGMGYSERAAQSLVRAHDGKDSVPSPSTREDQAAQDKALRAAMPKPSSTSPLGGFGITSPFMRARGGRISGIGMQDTVQAGPYRVAPGELVVNQHTERKVDERMGFPGALAAMVRGEHTPHGLRRAFARGGRTTLDIQQYLAKKFGLSPSSGYRDPSHNAAVGGVPNSYHTRGTPSDPGAIDLVGPVAAMRAASAWAAQHLGPEENLIHDVGSGLHLHLAFGGRRSGVGVGPTGGGGVGGGGGAPAPKIRLGRKGPQRGIPQTLERLAYNAIARGLERKINKRLAAEASRGGGGASADGAGGAVSGSGVGPRGGGTTYGASEFGGPADPGTGHIGYRGDDLNLHPDSFAELNMGTALGGLPYMAKLRVTGPRGSKVLRKRDIGAGGGDVNGHTRAVDLWYKAAQDLGINGLGLVQVQRLARGGRIPWLGRGGELTAHQPTLIGVGDRQAERVRVTPLTGPESRSREVTVHVSIDKVVQSEPGDIAAVVERELRRVGMRLSAYIDESEF